MKSYEPYFYSTRNQDTRHAASAILDEVLPLLPPVSSAVDVGCGVGTWLSVLREKGVKTIQGIDGFWVQDEQLEIPREFLRRLDLEQPIEWSVRYDLAVSLEVGEHLPASRAESFVEDLTNASDYVLFSAAIPYQGGYHHVNESWQSFWAGLFENRGYAVVDCIRPRFWADDSIPEWYRENLFLYARKGAPLSPPPVYAMPLDVVHPASYLGKLNHPDFRYGLWLAKRSLLAKYCKKKRK